jgi:hypothetical protein
MALPPTEHLSEVFTGLGEREGGLREFGADCEYCVVPVKNKIKESQQKQTRLDQYKISWTLAITT